MVDSCTIRRPNESAVDPDTGVITPAYTLIYSGPCRIQQRTPRAQPRNVGEAEVFVARLELHVPTSVTGVNSDDLVNITSSSHDQDLIGRSWHIRELAHKTYASARRFSLIEVTS